MPKMNISVDLDLWLGENGEISIYSEQGEELLSSTPIKDLVETYLSTLVVPVGGVYSLSKTLAWDEDVSKVEKQLEESLALIKQLKG